MAVTHINYLADGFWINVWIRGPRRKPISRREISGAWHDARYLVKSSGARFNRKNRAQQPPRVFVTRVGQHLPETYPGTERPCGITTRRY